MKRKHTQAKKANRTFIKYLNQPSNWYKPNPFISQKELSVQGHSAVVQRKQQSFFAQMMIAASMMFNPFKRKR